MRKILIMGLPGAGKTTLAKALARRLGAVHFNADEVRANLNKDLGFSEADRIEQARRMGFLCDTVVTAGGYAIADFVCPTLETRLAFKAGGNAFVVFVNRIIEGRFEDTNKLFDPPSEAAYDIAIPEEGAPEYWAEVITSRLKRRFGWGASAALLLGRYQPWHDGHRRLFEEALKRIGQVCIAVRDSYDPSPGSKNPFTFEEVAERIKTDLREYEGRFEVIRVPNITNIFYGRDVGYKIEEIDLDAATKAISATGIRRKLQG